MAKINEKTIPKSQYDTTVIQDEDTIDFDKVDISNLNRQQYMVSQLGMYKTEAMKENLQKIAPYVEVVTDTIKVDENNVKALLSLW